MNVSPSPFVYWAQTEKVVSLRIDLRSVEYPDFEVLEDQLQFASNGIGAHGQCKYKFSLDLYSPIKVDTSNGEKPATVRVSETGVDVILQKAKPSWWPRLTAQPQKPAWLKINFDLWRPESELVDKDEECRDIMKDYPGVYDKLQQEEMGYKKDDLIKTYMTFYNLVQLSGYLYCLSVMAARFAKLGVGSMPSTYEHVGHLMGFLQILQLMETLHPLLGLTRGSAFMPFFQVLGRIEIAFLLDVEPRLQSLVTNPILFTAWSLVESIRSMYYITQLQKKEIAFIKWLRYSAWMVLYPVGITCELTVNLLAISYFRERGIWVSDLPNSWNNTIDFILFLKVYTAGLPIAAVYLMTHMIRQRRGQLSPKVEIKKVK